MGSDMDAVLGTARIDELRAIVGDNNLIIRRDRLADYSHDEYPSEHIRQLPAAVVKPVDTKQVRQTIIWANKHRIPVTPRGGGTGMCGGCVPSPGGIVLSLEAMDRIISVDRENCMVTVEPGVRLNDFYAAVEKEGLFFPPHPGAESATVGGIIATNAGGARAVKYGTVRNFVRGIEVILPDGEHMRLGGSLLKNSTGYSLLHLMIGSEGTLGIITQAVLSLSTPPLAQMTLIAPFDDLEKAVQCVPAMGSRGITPMAVEFLPADVISSVEDQKKTVWPCKGGEAHVMIIIDGNSEDDLLRTAESIGGLCMEFGALDVFVAESRKQQKEILDFRSGIFETHKKHIVEVLDIVLPPSEISGHIAVINRLAREHNMWLPSFGHAADGNVHTHIMNARYADGAWKPSAGWQDAYPKVRDAIHADARKRGGMVSGEHGIGLLKREYLKEFVGDVAVERMRRIKKAFDPNSIMNPGKIV